MIARPSAASSRIVPSEMPLKMRARDVALGEPAFDGGQRALRLGAHLVVGFDELAVLLLQHRQQQRLRRAGVALRERANGGKPRRAVRARELDRRLRQHQQALDLGVGFLRGRGGDRRQRVLVGAVLQFLRRGEPNDAIGRRRA